MLYLLDREGGPITALLPGGFQRPAHVAGGSALSEMFKYYSVPYVPTKH